QARQSRWYCRNRWESRSVPFFTRKPLLETVKGFFRLATCLYFPVQCYCISSVLPCTMLLHIFRTSPTGAVLEPLLSLFKPPPTAPFRKGFGSLVTVG
ncbi:hypothetical protein, partial [Sphingobacterium sp. UBA6308]